jgi:hypothetical protein
MKIRVVLVYFLLILFGRLRLWGTELSAATAGRRGLLSTSVANRREQRRG